MASEHQTTGDAKGDLYVVEGMDGVGKSTVVETLAQETGAISMETPGTGVQEIRDYVDSEPHSRQTKFLMYLASNSAVSDQIEQLLDEGEDIVLDRYYPTTVVYNSAATEDEKWWEITEEFDFIEPTETFYLWADEQTRKERMHGRDETGERGEADDEFMADVREEYQKAVDRYDMLEIEAVEGVENVVERILSEV